MNHELYAGFKGIVGLCHDEFGAAAFEKTGEHLIQLFIDTMEGLDKSFLAYPVYLLDNFMKVVDGLCKIVSLFAQKVKTVFELLILLYGAKIDIVDICNLFSEPEKFIFHIIYGCVRIIFHIVEFRLKYR